MFVQDLNGFQTILNAMEISLVFALKFGITSCIKSTDACIRRNLSSQNCAETFFSLFLLGDEGIFSFSHV